MKNIWKLIRYDCYTTSVERDGGVSKLSEDEECLKISALRHFLNGQNTNPLKNEC